MKRTTVSERALILAPRGRDAAIASAMLQEAGIASETCHSLPELIDQLDQGAGLVVVTEEALATADLAPLAAWIADQEEWSDLPLVLLTTQGGGLERNPAARRFLDVLGNVTFLERPFHPTTLVSLAQAALRGRRRQYEARGRMEALRAGEARYRALFDSIESGFCVVELDLDGSRGGAPGRTDYRVVEANPAFYTQTGFPRMILGRWLRRAAPGLEEHWFETYGGVVRTGEPVRFEQGSIHLGRWFDVYAFRVGEPAEARVAILFNDISVRRQMEERLRESEERFRNMADHAPVMMWVTEPDGACTYLNRTWYEFTGQTPEEAQGFGWLEATHPDDQAEAGRVFLEANAKREAFRLEYRLRRTDGTYRWAIDAASPRFGAGGEFLGYVGSVTDIHERKAAQEALEGRVAEEVAERAKVEDALRQSQKMEAVGQLTGGLAHDFNNLLAGISGSLELMGNRIAQGRVAEVERYMLAAQGAAKRAASLTHRLLAFSRRQTLEPKVADLNSLVAGMEEMIRRTVGPGVEVEAVAKGGLWRTLVDPNQLENALLNLAINARDAMPEGGRLTIETANCWLDERAARERDLEPGQYVSLCVSDNGTGMTPDVVAKAFDPFFTTKPIGQGTGLGLSMIYGFARQSGGQVRIYSEVGQGTMVCLYLPRHLGEGDAAEAPAAAEGNERRGAGARAGAEAGATVLVVDDEPSVRMLVVDVVEELGLRALEAGTGPEGLEILRSKRRVDLLVTDVGLPGGLNGRQVADAARALRPELPVLFITGFAENALLNHGHLEPGMAVVTKPFDMARLASRIGEMVSKG